MKDLFTRSWWLLALYGIVAIAFGVLAILWPGITLLVLVAMFAAYALLQGSAAIFASIRGRRTDSKWWLVLLLGIVSVAAGVLAIFYPAITALALVLLMGANALVTGVLQIVIALRLRQQIRGEWLLVTGGVVSIIFGTLVMLFPAGGALAMVWLVSFYAVLTGVLFLTLGIRARSWRNAPAAGMAGRPAAAAHHH
jgi:uncharacterized membrane protein HdeD (DUF308 family)